MVDLSTGFAPRESGSHLGIAFNDGSFAQGLLPEYLATIWFDTQ